MVVEIFLLGILSKKPNKQGLYYGIIASVLFTAYALLTSTPMGGSGENGLLLDFGSFNFTHHKYMIGVYSHVILFVVGFVASLFYKGQKLDDRLTYSGWLKYKKEAGNIS